MSIFLDSFHQVLVVFFPSLTPFIVIYYLIFIPISQAFIIISVKYSPDTERPYKRYAGIDTANPDIALDGQTREPE